MAEDLAVGDLSADGRMTGGLMAGNLACTVLSAFGVNVLWLLGQFTGSRTV